jgi:hypothetical protein
MRRVVAVLLWSTGCASASFALPVAFGGTLASVQDPEGVLGPEFVVGAVFAGIYDFAPANAVVVLPGVGDNSSVYSLPIGSFSLSLGGTTFLQDFLGESRHPPDHRLERPATR